MQAEVATQDLAVELAGLRALVEELRAENARLLRLLKLSRQEAGVPGPAQSGWFESVPGPVHARSSAPEKVSFFAALFGARTDVYAIRWENHRTGKAGWLPAVRGGWRRGIRHEEREYLPLTAEVITAHLSGEAHLGLYPLLDGDRCWWMAADFDGPSAMLDALAYLKAARGAGVPAGLEVSRSGVGAHVWVFFASPVPAEPARRLGTGLLREAMGLRGQMDLSSYDRLFPSQDVLPIGGVGNLIAAPLQGRSRKNGATVFLDLATLEPYEDQWAFLSTLSRMSPREVTRAAERVGTVPVGTHADRLITPTVQQSQTATCAVDPSPAGGRDPARDPGSDSVTLGHAEARGVDAQPDLLRTAATPRLHLGQSPRFLRSTTRRSTATWSCRAGLRGHGDADSSSRPAAASRSTDDRDRTANSGRRSSSPRPLPRPSRRPSMRSLNTTLGVLVAPPGSGKTVIACAVIAARATSTLSWSTARRLPISGATRSPRLLGVKAGQRRRRPLEDDRHRSTSPRCRRSPAATTSPNCQRLRAGRRRRVPPRPSRGFEYAVKQIPARRWLGLTATPYRRDKLDDLIGLQLGPVRHTFTHAATLGTLVGSRRLAPSRTSVRNRAGRPPDRSSATRGRRPSAPGGIAAVYRAPRRRRGTQRADPRRRRGGSRSRPALPCLTQWTAHVDRLADALPSEGSTPSSCAAAWAPRHGRRHRRASNPTGRTPLLVVATGPYVGEGFDCPALDTLFLAAPIAFKGRLVQYAGRILRPIPGKNTAEVHDYHDVATAVLASSLTKRAPGYTSLGFPDPRTKIR